MARMSREERESRAILVANKHLEQRLERIGWEEEVLYPALERVKNGTLDVSYSEAKGIEIIEPADAPAAPELESGQ